MTEGVFVSYRREDAPGHAGRLYDRLVARFGPNRVFMDVDSIDPGEDFLSVIESTLSAASVVVVVIGPTWATARDEQGVVRLTKPDDFVHLEVSRALQLQKRVIPVRVDDAPVPRAEQLPEDLRPLARLNAVQITDVRFHSDADSLADDIEEILDGPPPVIRGQEPSPNEPIVTPPAPPDPKPEPGGLGERLRRLGLPVVIAVIIALLMVVGAVVWALSSSDDDTPTGPDTTSVATTAGESPATSGAAATSESTPPTAGTEAPTPAAEPSVIGEVPVAGRPFELAFAGDLLWATVDGGVERFEQPGPDATSLGTTDLGPGYGNDLLELDGLLYVTRYGGNALVAVDIATGTVTGEPIPMPGGALGAASSGESIWVAVHGSSSGRPGSVVEVRDGAIVDEIPLDSRPFGIEVVSGHPWVTFNDTGEVAMVDPATGQATRFPVGPRPVDIRLLGEQLWVTVSGENRIALLDPFSGNELGSIDVGASPWKVEEGFGAMWVTNQGDDTVMRIDPTTLEPGEAITVGDKPDEIAVGPDQLFIGNSGATSVSVIDPG